MRKIFRYLRDYQRKHFDVRLYLTISFFLMICFIFNYSLDFEDSYIDKLYGTFWHWLSYLFWMAFPYVGVSLILKAFGKDVKLNRQFWILIVIGFSIQAFDRSFDGYKELYQSLPGVDKYFLSKCLYWSSSLLTNVIPLMLIYVFLFDEHPRTYYGLAFKSFDPKPYFILLGGAIILIGLGSFFSDLQSYYPRFQHSGGERFAAAHDLPNWVSILIYEICYGSDFVAVEVFFRGFLIFAFSRALGGYAVLAMISSYAFLHFGKPLTEAVSSIFGGYILGIISYNTRSVWGGIIIHMGVAWTMELFGFLHKIL